MIVKARYGITFAKLNSTYEFEIVNSTSMSWRGGIYFFNSVFIFKLFFYLNKYCLIYKTILSFNKCIIIQKEI